MDRIMRARGGERKLCTWVREMKGRATWERKGANQEGVEGQVRRECTFGRGGESH